MNCNIVKTSFEQLLKEIIKLVIIPYSFYKIKKSDSQEIQKSVRQKEFDRDQTKTIIEIFRDILSILNNNARPNNKSKIPQEYLNKLETGLDIAINFNDDLKEEINKGIYVECLYYNDIGIVKNFITSSTIEPTITKDDNIDNENRMEEEKRKVIKENIIDKIRHIYSEF